MIFEVGFVMAATVGGIVSSNFGVIEFDANPVMKKEYTINTKLKYKIKNNCFFVTHDYKIKKEYTINTTKLDLILQCLYMSKATCCKYPLYASDKYCFNFV